jgi:hypothetical protein
MRRLLDKQYVIDIGNKRYRYSNYNDVLKTLKQLSKKSMDFKFWNFKTRELIQHSSTYVKRSKF